MGNRGVAHLLFRVEPYDFAVPADVVRHLDLKAAIWKLEGVPGWLAGVVEVAGGAIPVIDVGIRVGLRWQCESEGGAVIVIGHPRGEAVFPEIGLRVDRIADTVRIGADDVRQLRASSSLGIRDWVLGAYRGRSRASYLLDLAKVVPEELLEVVDRLSQSRG